MKSGNFLRVLAIIYLYFALLSSGEVYARTYDIYKGDTLRVMAPDYIGGRLVGTAIDTKRDTLTIQVGTRILPIPLNKIERLEVARGEKRNTKKGAIIGALSGGLGLGLGLAGARSLSDEGFGPSPVEALLVGTVLGVPFGGLTGAIIGSGSKSIHWVHIPIEAISVKEKAAVLPAQSEEEQTKATGQKQTVSHRRRWRFSVTLGTTGSGPANDIEGAMVRDGFDETLPGGWFGGPVEHPSSGTGFAGIGVPWSMQLTYSLNRRLYGALLFSQVPIGTTSGYRTGPEIFLDLNYYSIIISPMIIFKSSGILQLGGGPAWFINKIEQESVDQIIYREQKGRPGAVLMATLTYPARTRFFVKVDAQYRWTPRATFGPFKDTYRGISLAQLQAFEANFSHAFVGLGFGVRF